MARITVSAEIRAEELRTVYNHVLEVAANLTHIEKVRQIVAAIQRVQRLPISRPGPAVWSSKLKLGLRSIRAGGLNLMTVKQALGKEKI